MDSLFALKELLEMYLDEELESILNQSRLLEKGFQVQDIPIFQKSKKLSKILCENFNIDHSEFKYLKSYQTPIVNYGSVRIYRKPFFYILNDDLISIQFTEQTTQKTFSKNFEASYVFDTITQGIGAVIPKLYKSHFNVSPAKDSLFSLSIEISGGKSRQDLIKWIQFYANENSPYDFFHPKKLFNPLLIGKNKENLNILKDRLKLWDIDIKSFSKKELAKIIDSLPFKDFNIKDIGLLKKIAASFGQPISNESLMSGLWNENYYQHKRQKNFYQKLKNLLNA